MTEPLVGLTRLPGAKPTHHWADHAELLCLTHPDGLLNRDDLVELWTERDDLGEDPLEPSGDEGVPGDVDIVSALLEPTADELPQLEVGTRADRYRAVADDVFRHLAYRSGAFGTTYPFELHGGLLRRRRRTVQRSLYIYLLLASCLRYVRVASRSSLTSAFERLALTAIRAWLGPTAAVRGFGTTVSAGGVYGGPLWDKVKQLSEDLGEPLVVTQDDFHPLDHGDNGCDVVAWLDFNDKLGSQVILGQATCLTNWRNKQYESSYEHWRATINFRLHTINVVVIPFCFRRPDGTWFKPQHVGSALMDRGRLLWLLGTRPPIALPPIVAEVFAHRRSAT